MQQPSSTSPTARRLTAALGVAALATVAFLAPQPAEALAPAGKPAEYKVDPVHSSMVFKIQHMGIADFFGRFNGIAGAIAFDPAAPESSRVTISVEAENVDTGNEKRDQHLRSPDFFNAVQFPRIEFTSDKVAKSGDGFTVEGQLEMLGKKQPVTATISHFATGEVRGKQGLGATATFTIDRTDFGMEFMSGGGLGDEVEITLAIEAIQG